MERRVALISGGAKGIGRAIGMRLAQDGWRVAFCYRRSAEAAEETAQALTKAGAEVLSGRYDVSSPEECRGFVSLAQNAWGRVDALINCAGPYHMVPLLEETPEGWQEMFSSNLHSVFYLCQLVAPLMKAQKSGRIINFSMTNADRMLAQPQITGHYIAKAGVLILTRSLAKSLAPFGVTVNTISPGFVDSGSAPEDELKKMIKNIPAGYIGELKDAVSAAYYLLSEEARYVNGTNLYLSGAWGL